jgi:hypothetical protein
MLLCWRIRFWHANFSSKSSKENIITPKFALLLLVPGNIDPLAMVFLVLGMPK